MGDNNHDNILRIDDDLIERDRSIVGLNSKREVVEEALRLIIRLRKQEQVLALRGKFHWEGDLNELREGRSDDPR
jgi:Arc/MetJ family transcription regulator